MNDDSSLPTWASPTGAQATRSPEAPTAPDAQGVSQPDKQRQPRGGRRILLWTLIPLGVVLLAAVGVGGFYAWSQTRYAVVERGDSVMIRHGVAPFVAYEETDVDLALLPTTTRTELVAQIPVDGRAGTAAEIAQLREQVTACQDSLVPPCPPRRLGTGSVQADSLVFPKGNRMKIEWDAVDSRKGLVTTLLVNGETAPKPCPKTLTSAGTCTFTGKYDTEYTVTIKTTGPQGTTATVNETMDFTELKPSVKITKGKKVKGRASDTGRRGTFCQIVLHAEGFDGLTTYKSTVRMSGHKPYKRSLETDAVGELHGVIHSYDDPSRGSWVQVTFAGLTTKRLTWECGGAG